ncbi:hypothetical protein ACN38_g6065 [Penicillium nordicum]|uniref:Uncharacterized protein n=1 Tax=Penicillium nordicum TaxID=229535 RepID=A0A0M8P7Q8_9EURO|nr:hypothetical protein ACN38_g6065 [Penicillium nordicum]
MLATFPLTIPELSYQIHLLGVFDSVSCSFHPSLNQPEPERIAEREKLIMEPIGKDLTGNKKIDHDGDKSKKKRNHIKRMICS